VPNTIVVKAAETAEKLGNIRAQNIVLLGAFVKSMKLENVDWKSLIAKTVPQKAVELNLKAFDAGYSL
jgi:indolepyruvate ferredoxin oxidoreductase beta subunit